MTGKQPAMALINLARAKVLMTQAISLRSRMLGNSHVRFWRRAGEVNFSRLAIKLRPTPAQQRALEAVLWRCRTLYNTALEQRKTAWERCRVSVTRYQQEAELKAIRADFPEYAAIHSHVLQDVLARLDKTFQAF